MKKSILIKIILISLLACLAAIALLVSVFETEKKKIAAGPGTEKALNLEETVSSAKGQKSKRLPQVYIPDEVKIEQEKELQKNREITSLIELLDNAEWKKVQQAEEKLYEFKKEAIPGLLEKIDNASVTVKGQIAFLLGKIGDKEAVPALLKLAQEDNSYIRKNAVEALGKIKDGRALPTLIKGLTDEDMQVRVQSAWSLGEFRSFQPVDDILRQVIFEREEAPKIALVEALAKIKDPRATLTLAKELKQKYDETYLNKVVFSLGEIGDSRALPALKEHLDELKQYKPTEEIVIFQWEQAMRITEEAIEKIIKGKE